MSFLLWKLSFFSAGFCYLLLTQGLVRALEHRKKSRAWHLPVSQSSNKTSLTSIHLCGSINRIDVSAFIMQKGCFSIDATTEILNWLCFIQGTSQEPCPPCSVFFTPPQQHLQAKSKRWVSGRKSSIFGPDSYQKYTALFLTTLWGPSPLQMSFTPSVREAQPDARHAHHYHFPFTTPT